MKRKGVNKHILDELTVFTISKFLSIIITMIDTVKFKIPITSDQFKKILQKSSEITKLNHKNKTVEFNIINADIEIGSFNRKITIKAYDSSYILLEFSLPKFIIGNNVKLIYPSSIKKILLKMQLCLNRYFKIMIPYESWTIERLDICYAWKFPSQTIAEDYLKIIKSFDYPRKSKYLYKDSVMWRGRHYSLKFYLKLPEFERHDYKELIKLNYVKLAHSLLEESSGLLRYEITFRKEQLKEIFGKQNITYYSLLDQDVLETFLLIHLNQLVANLDKKVLNNQDVLRLLNNNYPKAKALRLFSFHTLYNSSQLNYRQIYKDNYNASTIWRNKKDLSKAGVGLPMLNKNIEQFSLTIPSELVINKDPNDSSAS